MAYNPFRHFWLKSLAVGITTLLWVAVGSEKTVERSLRAPLEFQNTPPNLVLVGDTPDAVDVRVRGASTALGRLSLGDVRAILDLTAAKPGPNLVHLATDHVTTPFGIEVTHVGPTTVRLVLEREERKTVPVEPPVLGDTAPGYEVRRVSVEPAEVEVEGPESAIRALRKATTEPIELKASAAPIRETVAIGILDSAARLRVPQQAEVTIDIQPVRTERTVGAVPVRMRRLQDGLRAQSTPPNVAVVVRADDEVLKTLGVADIEASVDLAGLGSGQYTLPVQVTASRRYGVVRIEPPQVRIRIR